MRARLYDLSVALLLISIGARADVSIVHDRFTDKTELEAPSGKQLHRELERHRIVPQVLTFYRGAKPEQPPPLVRLTFRVLTRDGSRFRDCHRLDALKDGHPFALPESRHQASTMTENEMIESVYVNLDWPRFVELSAAKSAEFRICTTELAISAAQLSDWRAIVAAGTGK